MRFAVSLPHALRRMALSSALLFVATTASAVECQLACRSTDCQQNVCAGGRCKLRDREGKDVKLDTARFNNIVACEDVYGDPDLELRFRSKGRWSAPPQALASNVRLAEVFKSMPPDACGVPSPACLQARMDTKVAAIGGHGIDDKVAAAGGHDNPCTLGLPCGMVVPPPAEWRFQLANAALGGTWTVKLARGAAAPGRAAQLTARVAGGTVVADGAWFSPGGQYAYTLDDASGRTLATGEFSLVSAATVASLKTMAGKRTAKGMSEALAWADALSAADLEWDAFQAQARNGAGR